MTDRGVDRVLDVWARTLGPNTLLNLLFWVDLGMSLCSEAHVAF